MASGIGLSLKFGRVRASTFGSVCSSNLEVMFCCCAGFCNFFVGIRFQLLGPYDCVVRCMVPKGLLSAFLLFVGC